jgi:hypothetical protein
MTTKLIPSKIRRAMLIAGYAMSVGKSRSWVHFIGFTVVLVMSINIIIDLEYPRDGIIRIDTIDYLFRDLRLILK